MQYNSNLLRDSFWLNETRKTAELILEGLSKEEIMDLSLNENIFGQNSERRKRDIVQTMYKRLNDFPEEILEYFLRVDVTSAKIFVLISILRNDRLFFEFMYEVFREHILIGNYILRGRDFDIFFNNKATQNEKVDSWSESNIYRLSSRYRTILNEAGVLDNSGDDKQIIVPFVDLRLKNMLIEKGFGPFVFVITGEQ